MHIVPVTIATVYVAKETNIYIDGCRKVKLIHR